LIVCDGQGVAHPRRFGLACHIGIMFNIPTIGCGKTRLLGTADEPGPNRGDSTPLIDNGKVVGSVLRTQYKVKPVFVSIGHLISLKTACEWIIRLTPRYRLPETTRQADQMVKRMKKGDLLV
jgi:deoxyribonuclease V